MTEPSVDEMMNYLIRGKKSALYLSLIIYSLVFVGILIICFTISIYLFTLQFIDIFYMSFVLYLLFVSVKLYKYKCGIKNQIPYYGGIYVAYYECTKCKSVYGGIFGKGPTQKSIIDKECIHKWIALPKDNFDEKYQKSDTDGN